MSKIHDCLCIITVFALREIIFLRLNWYIFFLFYFSIVFPICPYLHSLSSFFPPSRRFAVTHKSFYFVFSNNKTSEFCASFTFFDWNDIEPKRIDTENCKELNPISNQPQKKKHLTPQLSHDLNSKTVILQLHFKCLVYTWIWFYKAFYAIIEIPSEITAGIMPLA